MGNTIAICTDCLKMAQSSIDGYVKKAVNKEVRPLFPHPEIKVTISSVAITTEPEPQEVIEESVTEDESVVVTEDIVIEEEPVKTASKPKQTKKK